MTDDISPQFLDSATYEVRYEYETEHGWRKRRVFVQGTSHQVGSYLCGMFSAEKVCILSVRLRPQTAVSDLTTLS